MEEGTGWSAEVMPSRSSLQFSSLGHLSGRESEWGGQRGRKKEGEEGTMDGGAGQGGGRRRGGREKEEAREKNSRTGAAGGSQSSTSEAEVRTGK
eukprot:767218-Hanusia_phi.AAC.7